MLASLTRGYPLHSNFDCPSIPPNMHFLIHCHLLSLCIESPQFIHVHHQQFISFVFSSTQYIFHVHILFLLSSSCLDFISPLSCWSTRIIISRLLTLTSTLIFLPPCLLYLGVPPYPYPKDHAIPPTSCRGFPSLTPWPSHVPIIDQRYRPTA
jgi:hypothetical protein